MGVTLSRLLFSRLYYNCYEAGHTWDPSCNAVRLQLFLTTYRSLVPLYVLLNSSTQVLRHNGLPPDLPGALRTIAVDSHRSAFALGLTFFFIGLILCNMGWYFGYFSPWMLMVGGGAAVFLGSLAETNRRVRLYVVYMLQLALETFVALAEDFGIKAHPLLSPLLLGSSVALHTYLTRSGKVSSGFARSGFSYWLQFILGKDGLTNVEDGPVWFSQSQTLESPYVGVCHHHKTPCTHFLLKRTALLFGCGAGASAALRLASIIPRLLKTGGGQAVQGAFFNGVLQAFQLGTALACFSSVYNGTLCVLTRRQGRPRGWHSVPSSLLAAGVAHLFWPSQRIAFYALCNTLNDLYLEGVARQKLPSVHLGPNIMFTVICTILLPIGVLQPHYIRKSYINFLNGILGNRVSLVNWSAIANLGFNTAKVYKENLNGLLSAEHLTRHYMQTMWVWSIADHLHKARHHKIPIS